MLYASCVYQLTVSAFNAKIVGSTPLNNFDGTACDVDQGTIHSARQVLRGPMHHFRKHRELGGSLGVSIGRYAGSLQRLGGRRTDRFGNQRKVATHPAQCINQNFFPNRALGEAATPNGSRNGTRSVQRRLPLA